jgi:hypothetical protein
MPFSAATDFDLAMSIDPVSDGAQPRWDAAVSRAITPRQEADSAHDLELLRMFLDKRSSPVARGNDHDPHVTMRVGVADDKDQRG